MATIDPTTNLESLRQTFKGQIHCRGDAGFAEAATGGLWNRLIPQRMPDIIAVVTDEDDVVAAVKFAAVNGIKVAVRGGGHNWCQPSLRDNGMMIDLTNLNKVISIDVDKRTAVLQPIISNHELQAALKPHGLAYPSGHCPQVKISGYLLGGGMSWNQGTWGHGMESIEAIELVTPAGEQIIASPTENADYFWAARGAGSGMFAVATRFHVRLYPLPKAITGSSYFYPMSELTDVSAWLERIAAGVQANVELTMFMITAPPELADLCRDEGGKVILVTATAFAESEEEAKTALDAFEHGPVPPLSRSVAVPMDFEALFDLSGSMWPSDHRNTVGAMYSDAPLADLAGCLSDHFKQSPSDLSLVLFAIFTGPNVPAPLPEAAFSMSARYYGGPWTIWSEPEEDAANLAWEKECVRLLDPHASGHYIGETDSVTYPDHARKAFSPTNWQRLQELRSRYDPQGVFFDYFDGLSRSR